MEEMFGPKEFISFKLQSNELRLKSLVYNRPVLF